MNKGLKQQILDLRSSGKSYNEIASILTCSKGTISFHCGNGKTKVRSRVNEIRRDKKIMAVEYKGGKCSKCGYSKCLRALQFHHLDPNSKEFGTSTNQGMSKRWEVLILELDKCILLCANCHFEEHERLGLLNRS